MRTQIMLDDFLGKEMRDAFMLLNGIEVVYDAGAGNTVCWKNGFMDLGHYTKKSHAEAAGCIFAFLWLNSIYVADARDLAVFWVQRYKGSIE